MVFFLVGLSLKAFLWFGPKDLSSTTEISSIRTDTRNSQLCSTWGPNVDKMQIQEVLCTGSRGLTPLKSDIKVSRSSALPGFHPEVCEEWLTQPRTECGGAVCWGCHCPEIKPFSHWNSLTKTAFCIYLPHLISTPAWLPQSQTREKDTSRENMTLI